MKLAAWIWVVLVLTLYLAQFQSLIGGLAGAALK